MVPDVMNVPAATSTASAHELDPGAPEVLTPAEVAQRLRMSESLVYEMARDGRLKKIRFEKGRKVLFSRRYIDSIIESSDSQ